MSVCQKSVRQTKDKDVQSRAIYHLFCALFKTNCWVFFLSISDNLSVIKLLKLSFKQWIWICRCYARCRVSQIHKIYSTKVYALSKKTWAVIGCKSQKGPVRFLHWQLSQPCGAKGRHLICGAMCCIVFSILTEASWEYRKDFCAILSSFNE